MTFLVSKNCHYIYIYWTFYPQHLAFGVSKRDYLIARKFDKREDGSVIIAQKSVVDHSLFPEQSGYVRGDLLCSGYVIKPVKKPNETTASSCHVTYVIQTDVKGRCDLFLI